MEELIEKRNELAVLLNFTSYGEMTLASMMAKSVDNVQKFHDNLRMKIAEKAKEEIIEINKNVTSKYHKV